MKRKPRIFIDTTNLKIESGIPIPPKTRGGRGACKYPIETMAVGDSFFLSDIMTFNCGSMNTVAKKKGLKATFVYRKVHDALGKQIGIRV